MRQQSKRIARLEGPGNEDEIVTITTHDGDIVMTVAEWADLLNEIGGKSRGCQLRMKALKHGPGYRKN